MHPTFIKSLSVFFLFGCRSFVGEILISYTRRIRTIQGHLFTVVLLFNKRSIFCRCNCSFLIILWRLSTQIADHNTSNLANVLFMGKFSQTDHPVLILHLSGSIGWILATICFEKSGTFWQATWQQCCRDVCWISERFKTATTGPRIWHFRDLKWRLMLY